jgi:zinc and cadmium transporter
MILMPIILSTFAISLCVWVAVIFLFLRKESLVKVTVFLVAFSAGALMGGAFLHLLPEALEQGETESVFGILLAAFAFFFLIEKLLHWRHCHNGDCAVHSFGYMNLLGDSVHNFIDGLVIASTFMIDFRLGMATALAVAIHEIPQEIGDYGVLVHSGFNKFRALLINFVTALTVVLGGLAGYFFFSFSQGVLPYLLPLAAGGFIYIAASDLMPELRKEASLHRSIITFFVFVLGIFFMFLAKFIGH